MKRTLLFLAGLVWCCASAAAAAVDVALVPSASSAPLGADVWVTLRVTQAGSLFNGYSAVIDFDPAALAFVPEPSQEGTYMLSACGSTFHTFDAQSGRLTIQHYLFCSGLSLSGPGNLYLLHFRTTGSGGATTVSFSQLRFYNAGHPVAVGSMVNATIQIEGPTDTGIDVAARWSPLGVTPNPFIEKTSIRFQTERPGMDVRVTILDVRGRHVRTLTARADALGRGTATWDGFDDAKRHVAAGAYLASLRTPTGVQTRRIVLAR